MSILGKVVEFVASDAIVDALEVPKKALQKASEKSNQKHSEKTQLLFEKEPGKNVLLLNQKQFTWVDRFNVYSVRRRITIGCNSKLNFRLTPIRPRGLACNCTFLSA